MLVSLLSAAIIPDRLFLTMNKITITTYSD